MTKTLRLEFGRAPGLSAETIATTPVTVFVGPNNSGKSKVLAEIHRYCTTGQRNTTNVIVDQIGFHKLSQESADERIRKVTLQPRIEETLQPDHVIVGTRGNRRQVPRSTLLSSMFNTDANPMYFCQWYLAYNTMMLDGRSRIDLVNDQDAGDLQLAPQTSFQVLFKDNARRTEVRRIVHDAFDTHLVVDPTRLGKLRLRLSATAPASEEQERGIHEDSVRFHGNALPIQQASDGVKAFAGIPAVGVVDIDVLKEGGVAWTRFLDGGFFPELERESLRVLRNSVKTRLDATGRDMKRDGGHLRERLCEYGLFVVKNGELESWLPGLGASGHGPSWLIDAVRRMGEDPENESYLRPGIDDVWSFVAEIERWLIGTSRRGIPS